MSDGLVISGIIAAMSLASAAVALTIGRRLARWSRFGAVLVSGLVPSITFVLVEGILFARDVDVHGDGPAMALVGAMIYAVLGLPLTLSVATLVIWRHRPR